MLDGTCSRLPMSSEAVASSPVTTFAPGDERAFLGDGGRQAAQLRHRVLLAFEHEPLTRDVEVERVAGSEPERAPNGGRDHDRP